MPRHFKCLILLVFTALLAVGPIVAGTTAYAQNKDIEYLRTESENARSFADKQRNIQERWIKKAQDARKEAKESRHKRDREGWLDDAKIYERNAEQAAIGADQAEAKAVKAEAELMQALKELKNNPAENPADTQPLESSARKDKPKYQAVSLEKTIATWRIKETDSSFVIVQEEPGSKIHGWKLEAHTGERVWKGTYTPFEEGNIHRSQDARVVFKYTPRAEEMNKKIPEWARKKIEGQLEWKIELDDAGGCGNPALSGYLFPGEVKWSKDKEGGPVKITDRGEPRPIELERVYDFELDMIGRPSLVVTTGGTHDPLLKPIEGLTKRQHFFVKVVLPKKMAEKQGETLKVQVKGLSGGESDTITLNAGGARKSKASVNYTHTKPATIADSSDVHEEDRTAKFLSWGWWMDSVDGNRLDMDVENNEYIEFRFNDMFETIPVYNSWVQRSLSRYQAGAGRLQVIFEAERDDPEKKEERKDNIARLQMLENLKIIATSGYLTDIHKRELFKRYIDESIGIVFSTPEGLERMQSDMRWQDTSDRRAGRDMGLKMLKGFYEGLTGEDLSSKIHKSYENVKWVAPAEKQLVKKTIRKANESIKGQSFDELSHALAFGFYEGVVVATGAATLYIIETDLAGRIGKKFDTPIFGDGARDHFGKKKSSAEVAMAYVSLGSEAILSLGGGTALSRLGRRNIGVTFGGGKGIPVKLHMNRLGAPVKTKRIFRGETPVYQHPLSLKPAQRAQVKLKLPPGYEAAQKAVVGKATVPGVRGGTVKKYDPAVDRWLRDTDVVDEFYGAEGDIVDALDDRIAKRQCFEDCNIRTDAWVHARHGKPPKGSVEIYTQLKKADILDEYGLYKGENVLQKGAPNSLSRKFNELNGFQTIEVPAHANASMTLEEMSKMKKVLKADEVKVVLAVGDMDAIEVARRSGGNISYHAVIIHKIKRDAKGVIDRVQFFDPAVARIVELPACAFNDRLAKHTSYSNTTLYIAPKKAKPTIEYPKIKDG